MKDIFKTKTIVIFLTRLHFPKEMFRYRLEIMPCVGLKIWDLVSKEMKQVTTLNQFKAKIKTWKLENCP